ncbi:MAG TPA: hypothetical protein VGL25_11050 [Casimicrobiaceae bacterium]|jgi:hypothetical protein
MKTHLHSCAPAMLAYACAGLGRMMSRPGAFEPPGIVAAHISTDH